MKELAFSFNIVLSKEITNRLKSEQKKIYKVFSERRPYDSSPHLSIATKFMAESDTDAFVEVLRNEFSDDKCWELTFSNFTMSENGNYLFLNLDNTSKEKIFKLHERAFKASKKIGSEGMNGQPPKHSYDSHVSVTKLNPDETKKAIKMIQSDFNGATMTAKKYEITRQEDDSKGFANFPVIDEINLR